MERIYSLNERLSARLLVNSVTMESDQVSAGRLWHAARGAGRLGTTPARVKKILQILLNLLHQYLYISS
jgi:hypothetical protein